jgi:hypothetical protein
MRRRPPRRRRSGPDREGGQLSIGDLDQGTARAAPASGRSYGFSRALRYLQRSPKSIVGNIGSYTYWKHLLSRRLSEPAFG